MQQELHEQQQHRQQQQQLQQQHSRNTAATANLKRQDKCDNLSAFWTAGTPATWHKINVKQNGGTAKQQGWQGQGHEQKGAAGGRKFPFAASASLSAKNCCKMMWAVPDRLDLAFQLAMCVVGVASATTFVAYSAAMVATLTAAAKTTSTAKASAIWLIRNKLGNAYMAAFCGK